METIRTRSIRLFLLDDHAMFRQALSRMLEQESDFEVVGQFGSSSAALEALDRSRATMILLDVNLGRERGLDFIRESRKNAFRGLILVLTAGLGGREAVQLVEAGVVGIVHKHHSTGELCARIRRAVAGEVYLEPVYATALFRAAYRTKPDRSALTERDKVVLRFLVQGLTNREIGSRLKISESGVKSRLGQLFDKLGVRTRTRVVRVALEQYGDEL